MYTFEALKNFTARNGATLVKGDRFKVFLPEAAVADGTVTLDADLKVTVVKAFIDDDGTVYHAGDPYPQRAFQTDIDAGNIAQIDPPTPLAPTPPPEPEA